ncbi:hypothetical protein B0H11DRAFT_2240890 [Mycena galericulata]|nr:hypothetical protein B0H11DRAFT_2240890 [Mycena galericulata]
MPPAPSALDKPEAKQPLLHTNPALLSLVAATFQEQIQTRVPHGRMPMHLAAPAFDGRTAIDLIARIIKQPDRGLALRVAQALDAQGFFKAVDGAGGSTDEFRDDEVEVYRVRMRTEMWTGMGPAPGTGGDGELNSGVPAPAATGGVISADSFGFNAAGVDAEKEIDVPQPTGVFTLLTDCYSPTCGRIGQDQRWPCYSVSCPRRRLNAVA